MPDEGAQIITIYSPDGIVRWKPAGNAGGRSKTANDDWIDGPECPVHGPWVVKARKDGSGYFYSCKVKQGEPWCKYRVSTREGSWGEANPPRPQDDDFGYTSDEDLFGG